MLFEVFFILYCVIYYLVCRVTEPNVRDKLSFSLSLITPPELPEKSGLNSFLQDDLIVIDMLLWHALK